MPLAFPLPRVVEIDLTPFSIGRRPAWAGPVVVFSGVLLWFLFLIYFAIRGYPREALVLGALTMLAIFIGFIVTTIQRMSSSTAGLTASFIRWEDWTKQPPHFDRPLVDIIRRVDEFRSVAVPDSEVAKVDPDKRSKRLRATLYIIFGLLIVIAGIPLLLAMRLGGGLLAPAVLLLCAAMYGMFTRARRVVQPSADLLTEHDPRKPILFLRSFQDDRLKLKQRVSLLGAPANQTLRFEESLGLMLRGHGPFLAVGEPGEGLPQLGAARAYLSDDKWQEAVLAWIRSARVIVMVAGPTPWIRWELQNVIREQRLSDLLLLLPPGRTPKATDERLERWTNIVQSFADTPFQAALNEIDARDTLLVQFRPDGRVLAYHSQYDLTQDYQLAVTLALYTALTAPEGAGLAAGPSAESEVRPERMPRRYVPIEPGVRGAGGWLLVQGLAFIWLFIPFVQYMMRIPANYKSPLTWSVFGAFLLLGALTSVVGVGALMQRRGIRIPGLVVCVIGIIGFALFSFEWFEYFRTSRRLGRHEMFLPLSPVFMLGYLTALVVLARWRREPPISAPDRTSPG